MVSKVDFDALKKRFEGFPVPEGPYDFSAAAPQLLTDFGLPPKPDAAHPLRLKAWERGFGKPVALQPFMFDAELVDRIEKTEYRLLHRQADEIRVVETRFESSSNWSGAYITANHNRRFLQIWGAWTIPVEMQLPPGPFQGPHGETYVCSNWIGLDGQRRYLDSSLPQIGTQSTLQGDGTTTAEAWVQWWARGGLNDPPILLPVGFVSPGDDVLCVLTALSPQTVIFVMVNLSATPWPTAIAVKGSAPLVTLPNGTTVEPTIAGATAEWIVERPEDLGLAGALLFSRLWTERLHGLPRRRGRPSEHRVPARRTGPAAAGRTLHPDVQRVARSHANRLHLDAEEIRQQLHTRDIRRFLTKRAGLLVE